MRSRFITGGSSPLLAVVIFGILTNHASAAGISVDWANGSGGASATTVMALGETAGVVPLASWNSFLVQTAPATGAAAGLVNDLGAATTAAVSWTYNNPWSIPIADTAGNLRMMKGYLDSAAATTTTVSFTGIPFAQYDVYVYTDGDNGAETRSGSYTIGATSLINTDTGGNSFTGTFVQGTNYVKFSGLTGAAFTLNATPVAGPATPRAPVNGIQIVQVPEPGSVLLALFGGLALLRRRRNETA